MGLILWRDYFQVEVIMRAPLMRVEDLQQDTQVGKRSLRKRSEDPISEELVDDSEDVEAFIRSEDGVETDVQEDINVDSGIIMFEDIM